MAVTAACCKWTDVLESQFDKSWVELDTILSQLEEDEDYASIHKQSRRAAASLASCFSQLAHKSTTVFQNNAKLEAELVHLREEVAAARAEQEKAESNKHHMTALLQANLLETQSLREKLGERLNGEEVPVNDVILKECEEETIPGSPVAISPSPPPLAQITDTHTSTANPAPPNCSSSLPSPTPLTCPISPTSLRPQTFPTSPIISATSTAVLGMSVDKLFNDPIMEKHSVVRLLMENKRLRAELLELESEMVGARLDNVYLDKELAGRIQQIQLLLASNTPADRKEKMWSQIESEMCLQRSKTIAQMCKTKQEVKCRMREESTRIPVVTPVTGPQSLEDTETEARHGKQAMILKNPADDLGMAIIGGREHNLPIIISEIFPGTAVARSNRVNAGDIILTVNGENFTKLSHPEAVNFLSSLRGQIIMELRSAEIVSEDDPSNLDYRFYKIFDTAITKEDVDHASVSNYSSRRGSCVSHPGKAVARVDLDSGERVVNGDMDRDIPSVHSSPRRTICS